MIENEELEQWISEFYPTVETDVLEVLRARVQYCNIRSAKLHDFRANWICRGNKKDSYSRNY